MIFWDRTTLKDRAKFVLKNTYWMTFLALIVVSLLGGGSNSSSAGISAIFSSIISMMGSGAILAGSGGDRNAITAYFAVASVLILIVIAISLFAFAYTVFLGNVILVGKSRFLSMCRYGEVNIGEIFFSFKSGRYMNTVKVMFMRSLNILLWSMLFVIPGIIKSYEYWMVPYILAENPNISRERAFEISSRTTYGEKWEMFILHLSFIGWMLLGTFAGCGIGALFVYPYYEATEAELYGALRYKAVMRGLCTPDEIGRELFMPVQ